jgi:hypothetical protein
VSGLIGVQTDTWKASGGTGYFLARMNRRECAERYHDMINESEKNITMLISRAKTVPGTFDAYSCLAFALRLAEANDNFAKLAHVLHPAMDKPFSYGNADAIKTLRNENAALITLNSVVEGDVNGRFEKAFNSFFTGRGFKITAKQKAAYLLAARFMSESADFGPGQTRKFFNWTLDANISNRVSSPSGAEEVFVYSGNGRQGANSEQQARQVMYRAIERNITDTEEEDGFAQSFEAFLTSLLQ